MWGSVDPGNTDWWDPETWAIGLLLAPLSFSAFGELGKGCRTGSQEHGLKSATHEGRRTNNSYSAQTPEIKMASTARPLFFLLSTL